MFVKELTADADYFLVNEYFASLVYDGESVEYKFQLYGRLIQALIEGADTIKVSLIRKVRPKIKYFVGSSMSDVEVSNIGFVENTKEQLKKALQDATIAEVEHAISDFLPDEIVSGIGNGSITLNNYTQYLPVIEQLNTFNRTTRKRSKTAAADIKKFKELSYKLFSSFGIYPGRVSEIAFPAEKLSEDSDGLSFGMKTNSNKSLLQNHDFNDYYETYFLKEVKSRVLRRFVKKKAEYQKFVPKIKLSLEDYDLSKLSNYNNLSVRISLLNNDIETAADVFSFDNLNIYEEATAGVEKVEADLLVYDERFVLPDELTVTNKENYPVEVTIFEFHLEKDRIAKKQLGIFALESGETITQPAETIFYHASESRTYVVTANKLIPGVAGVSNVIKVLNPPQSSSPPPGNPKFSINVEPGKKNTTAKVLISGIETEDQNVLLYRKRIGTGEKTLIGTATKGRSAIVDSEIQLGDVNLYTAELQLNGASQYAKASTGFISIPYGDVSRVNFSIQNQKLTGGRFNTTHSFKIVENISSTAASELLGTVNAAGQAGEFSSELSETKTSTTVITNYYIFRVKRSNSSIEYMGTFSAGKALRFRMRDHLPDETYEYIVLPSATSTSALSYTSVAAGTDISSGNGYNFLFKKFRDSNFPRQEVLPSYTEVEKNDVALALLTLPPGLGQTITFTKSASAGRVVKLQAVSKDNTDCTFLSWKYSGDSSSILHFIIFASYNGFKAPIGMSVPDQTIGSNIISYCDEKLGGVSGEVIYSVMPVLITGEKGIETNGVRVKSTKNYPRKALK